jgi:hypothetical protein
MPTFLALARSSGTFQLASELAAPPRWLALLLGILALAFATRADSLADTPRLRSRSQRLVLDASPGLLHHHVTSTSIRRVRRNSASGPTRAHLDPGGLPHVIARILRGPLSLPARPRP